MDSVEAARTEAERPPWITFTLTALFLIAASLLVRDVALKVKAHFEVVGMESPPLLTKGALLIGPFLWILVLGCVGGGLYRIRKVRRASADYWMLAWFLGSLFVFGGMAYFLISPLDVMTPLRKY